MSKVDSRDRLQPSLLDRLIDDDPNSPEEPVDQRALSRQELRAAVLRDLGWLFNATRLQSNPAGGRRSESDSWDDRPEARHSVINYGIPSLTGASLSRSESFSIQQGIAQAIRDFEPRIDAKTLEVRVGVGQGGHGNVMQIEIRGRMWAQPVPLELLLSASLDVETGTAQVRDLRA